MKFKIANVLPDLDPSNEDEYQRIMQPLWKKLEGALKKVSSMHWEMIETVGPTVLVAVAEAEIEDPRVEWIEIRGEDESIELSKDGQFIVTLKWSGTMMYSKAYADEARVGGLQTDTYESPGEVVPALNDMCQKHLKGFVELT